jgi:hypothetical protein
MVLRGATSLRRELEGVGPENRDNNEVLVRNVIHYVPVLLTRVSPFRLKNFFRL